MAPPPLSLSLPLSLAALLLLHGVIRFLAGGPVHIATNATDGTIASISVPHVQSISFSYRMPFGKFGFLD
eukprot:COSAG06_NODE_2253_length_7231_cov_5.051178_7_plen_70_part_00